MTGRNHHKNGLYSKVVVIARLKYFELCLFVDEQASFIQAELFYIAIG